MSARTWPGPARSVAAGSGRAGCGVDGRAPVEPASPRRRLCPTATAARAPESTASGLLCRGRFILLVLVLVRLALVGLGLVFVLAFGLVVRRLALGFVVGLEHDLGGVLGRDVRVGGLDLVGFRLGLSVGRLVGLGRGRFCLGGTRRLPAAKTAPAAAAWLLCFLVSH